MGEIRQKLESEKKNVKGEKQKAVASAVIEALCSFAEQDGEFADAILQGKTLDKCLDKVMEGVGNAISDIEVYKKAVEFYFQGAEVDMMMTIRVNPNEEQKKKETEEKKDEFIILSLDDII